MKCGRHHLLGKYRNGTGLAIVRAFHNHVALRYQRDQYPYRPYLFDDSGLDSGVEELLHDLASASGRS